MDGGKSGCLPRGVIEEVVDVQSVSKAQDTKNHGHEDDKDESEFDQGAALLAMRYQVSATHLLATRMLAVLEIVRLLGIPGKLKSAPNVPEHVTDAITTQWLPVGQVPAVAVPLHVADVIAPPLSQPHEFVI